MNNLKYSIDSFNYTLRSTAGYSLVLFAMIVVQLFATTTFFLLLMHEGKAWMFKDGVPDAVSYFFGFMFAFCLEFGIYFAAINGWKDTSNLFAFVSFVLALISFRSLVINPETSQIVVNIDMWVNLVGIIIIAGFPNIFIPTVAHKLHDMYDKEGWKAPVQPTKSSKRKNRKKETPSATVVDDDFLNELDSFKFKSN